MERASAFVVVRFVAENGKGTIELFDKEESHHLVVESHLRERHLVVGNLINRRGKAESTANDKHQVADT